MASSGALLLCEALDNSGVIAALGGHLVDHRDPQRVRHSLASQLDDLTYQAGSWPSPRRVVLVVQERPMICC